MNKAIVLIPHYNNPKGLERSLASIDPSDCVDVLIVDDGSKQLFDEQILKSSFKANGTIYYIYLETNKGIEYALNTGLEYISQKPFYKYIARLDSDDQCVGRRFTIQQEYLESNPDVKLVGSNAFAVDTEGTFLYNMVRPEGSEEIKNKMYLNSMFIHPSVMFCSDVIANIGYYPINYKAAEDYAFFFKIVKKYKTANLQQSLIKYEVNPGGISLTQRKQQVKSRLRVMKDNFYFGFYPIYGLARSVVLYIMPYSVIKYVKTNLK